MSQSGAPEAVIELSVGAHESAELVSVMHRAFAEFASRGEPAGAMLETAATMADEMASGVQVAVVRSEGRIVALAKHHDAGDGSLYVGRLGVLPEWRGRGLASRLMLALRAHAHERGLEGLSCAVRAAEVRNIALYERLGMRIVRHMDRASRTGAVIACVEMRDVVAPH